jgi:hypothetical protein
MVWTAPKTWLADELVTASNLNLHLRDNLNILKIPAQAHRSVNSGANFTTSSTTFVDVNNTYFLHTLATKSTGNLFVNFVGSVGITAGNSVTLDIAWRVSAGSYARLGSANSGLIVLKGVDADTFNASFSVFITGIATPGSYDVKLQWRVDGGTATLYNVTTITDVRPQFSVIELG